MSELQIKVNIVNRTYPLKINREDEDVVRKAAQLIADKLKEYETSFAVTDKQDLLAMCVMHFVTELVHRDKNQPQDVKPVIEQIDLIDSRLSNYLHTIDVH